MICTHVSYPHTAFNYCVFSFIQLVEQSPQSQGHGEGPPPPSPHPLRFVPGICLSREILGPPSARWRSSNHACSTQPKRFPSRGIFSARTQVKTRVVSQENNAPFRAFEPISWTDCCHTITEIPRGRYILKLWILKYLKLILPCGGREDRGLGERGGGGVGAGAGGGSGGGLARASFALSN